MVIDSHCLCGPALQIRANTHHAQFSFHPHLLLVLNVEFSVRQFLTQKERTQIFFTFVSMLPSFPDNVDHAFPVGIRLGGGASF